MTQEQKNKINKNTDWIPKILTPALLITISVSIFNFGKQFVEIKSRTFESVEDKIKTKKHINHSPNDVEVYKEFLEIQKIKKQDSIYKINFIKSTEKRDRIDSLNAVQFYLIKEEIKKLNNGKNK